MRLLDQQDKILIDCSLDTGISCLTSTRDLLAPPRSERVPVIILHRRFLFF